MKEYIDIIFLENFIFSILVMYQTSIFTKEKVKNIRLIIASTLCAGYSVATVILSNSFFDVVLIRVLVINIIIYIAFLPKQTSKYVKLLCYFYIISFCYVGVVIFLATLLKINMSNEVFKISLYALGYLLTYLCNKYMWRMWKSIIRKDSLVYEVKIGLIDKKELTFDAFIDTGNNIKYLNTNIDVILIDKKFIEEFQKYFEDNSVKVEIPIMTLNKEENLKGYIVSKVEIKKGANVCILKKAIIAFTDKTLSKSNMYQALIGYDTYVDKLQGVIL